MPKLLGRFKAEVPFMDGIVTFTLHQPTNEDVNEYYAAQSRVLGMDLSDADRLWQFNMLKVELFDNLLEDIENLTNGDGGPVTTADKGKIPFYLKLPVIMKLGLDTNEATIKN